MIRKIHSRSEIIDSATMLEFLAVALIFMLPVLFNKAVSSRKNHKNGPSYRSREDISTSASTFFDSQSDEDEERQCLMAE